VSLAGTHIIGSPFNVEILRGDNDPDPSKFDVFGKGIEGGDTADPCEFTVVAKNSKGEQLSEGGHNVDVQVFGPTGNEVPAKVQDNKDGTYSVSYQPLDPGNHLVDVTLRTKIPLYYDHIKDSTYTVPVVAGTDAAASLVWGPGLEDVYDTIPATFFIKARDREGKDMGRGGDPFKVEILGPTGEVVPAEIVDNNDGTYNVTYAPEVHGPHKVAVTLRDKPVAKSPYTVNVKEGASHEHSNIERFQFAIRAKTKSGTHKLLGGDKFKVDIQGPEGPLEGVKVTDLNDGLYLCDYTLENPGEYTIACKINNHHIKGSPFHQKF